MAGQPWARQSNVQDVRTRLVRKWSQSDLREKILGSPHHRKQMMHYNLGTNQNFDLSFPILLCFVCLSPALNSDKGDGVVEATCLLLLCCWSIVSVAIETRSESHGWAPGRSCWQALHWWAPAGPFSAGTERVRFSLWRGGRVRSC